MISTLILAAALGQLHANDGPARQWLPAVVGGQTVYLWGWRDSATGGVGYLPSENTDVFKTVAPRVMPPKKTPAPAPILPNTGMVIESNGTLNSGLNLHETRPTQQIETNDPELGNKLGLTDEDCPNGRPCPRPRPRPEPEPEPWQPHGGHDYTNALAGIAVAILIAAYVLRKTEP